MARGLAVVFHCGRLWPMGSALLHGLFGPNQMPSPAWVSVVLFEVHKPSMYIMMLGGCLALGSHLAGSREHFSGFVKIPKFSCLG